MQTRPFRSIASLLIQQVIAIAVVCFLAMCSLHAVIEFRAGEAAFQTALQDIATASTPQFSISLWDIESDAVHKQLALIAQHPEVAYVQLWTLTGERYEAGDKALSEQKIKIKVNIPSPAGGNTLGTLQITGRDAFRYAKIERDILQLLLGYLVFVTAICLAIVVLLRRRLERPLSSLYRFACELVPGAAPAPFVHASASKHHIDEVDVLAEGFQLLQSTVYAHVADLDQLVAARTSEIAMHNQILDMISRDVPLHTLLEVLIQHLESLQPDALCSVLLLDQDGKCLRTGAASRLPLSFLYAVDPVRIGEGVGSCGTAAFRAERVVVEDVADHPFWAEFRSLTSQAGLRACWSEPIIGSDGQVLGTFAVYHRHPTKPTDAQIHQVERKARLAALAIERKRSGERLKTLSLAIAQSPVSVVITDPFGVIGYVNPKYEDVTGYASAEAIGKALKILRREKHSEIATSEIWTTLSKGDAWTGDFYNQRKDGQMFWEHVTISPIRDEQGSLIHFVAVSEDITQVREHQMQLEHIAHYDALTNLPNRSLLADRLLQGMAHAQRRGSQLAVAYLDLDGFKAINDQYGHATGDQMLIVVASRMKQVLREVDTLARIGGDEFVVVLVDLHDANASLPMLNRLLAAACETVQIDQLSLRVSASLGVTFYPQMQETEADQLLRQADHAMYQAKVGGKNRYSVFDAET